MESHFWEGCPGTRPIAVFIKTPAGLSAEVVDIIFAFPRTARRVGCCRGCWSVVARSGGSYDECLSPVIYILLSLESQAWPICSLDKRAALGEQQADTTTSAINFNSEAQTEGLL